MQYRVKQIGPWFYPQYQSFWGFWRTFQTKKLQYNTFFGELVYEDADDCKLTLEKALDVIKSHKESLNMKYVSRSDKFKPLTEKIYDVD